MILIPNNRKILLALATTLISLSLILISSEVVLKTAGYGAGPSIRTASDPTFDQIPGIFEPNQDIIDRHKPPLEYRIRINSLGFRGHEFNLQKTPGTRRILCLGDSFTYGPFVNDDETFPYYLEKMLQEAGLAIEVINGGVEDTTIVDHLAFLKKNITVSPDIVILTFYENDIDDLVRTQPMYVSLEKNRKLKSAPIVRTFYQLLRDSAIFNFLLSLRGRKEFAKRLATLDNIKTIDRDSLWQSYESSLEAMNSFLKDRSIAFVFAIYPSAKRIAGELDTIATDANRIERVQRLSKKYHIPTIDLESALRESKRPVEYLYLRPHDEHASKHGNRLVADALAEFIAPYVQTRVQ